MSTLYKVIKSSINKGNTEGMQEKLDVLYAGGRFTTEEYRELVELLQEKLNENN